MMLKDSLAGRRVALRTALEDDAKFILKLRLDPELNKFINKTDSSAANQRKWIKEKQRQKNDYHMIIEDLKGKRLGTVAVYNINYKEKTFEWGRWVISRTAPFYASIESCILIYRFAFETLLMKEAIFDVENLNKKVISFHKQFGAHVVKRSEKTTWFIFRRDDFKKALVKYKNFHTINDN